MLVPVKILSPHIHYYKQQTSHTATRHLSVQLLFTVCKVIVAWQVPFPSLLPSKWRLQHHTSAQLSWVIFMSLSWRTTCISTLSSNCIALLLLYHEGLLGKGRVHLWQLARLWHNRCTTHSFTFTPIENLSSSLDKSSDCGRKYTQTQVGSKTCEIHTESNQGPKEPRGWTHQLHTVRQQSQPLSTSGHPL